MSHGLRWHEGSRWMRASEALRERLRRHKDRAELERLLERVERAALQAGRELGLEEAHRANGTH